jgi:hypothetical protein
MKKIIFCIVMLCFIFPAILKAQTEKGKALVGVSSRVGIGLYTVGSGPDLMSFGFANIKYKSDDDDDDSESDKISGVNMAPRIGYFFLDDFTAGIDFNLSSWTEKYGDSENKYNMTLFSAGPFARYYFHTKKVNPFLEGYGYFGILKEKETLEDGDDWDNKMSNNTYGGGVGLAVPIGDRASFDIMFGYNSNTLKDNEDNEENYRTVIGTFGVRFGFVFYLGKAKE